MIELSPSRGVCWLRAALLLAALALGLPNAVAQLVAPVIVSHPQSQTAAVGADVVFNIAVTNTASLPLTNRLRKAGQNIATNIVNERSTSFTLRNVQTNDASTYSIGVLNAAANRLSSNATLTVFKPVAAAGHTITSESCLPANGGLDPGETVTVGFALSATNGYSAANLVAMLEETNGVVAPGGPQTYGALPADGTPVTRPFTFTANGTCGGQVRATLRLFDGSNDWGRVTFVLPLGITTANGPECCTADLADLAVTISNQPEVVALASNVTWTINVTNRGPETAHDVVVTNRLAPELLYVSAQAGAGACAVQQGVLVCQISELPANSSWPITITALANAVGTITNQAGVTSAQADPSGADNVTAGQVTRLIQPTVRINNTTVDEGESGTSYAIFDVRLSFPIQRTVTVQYATADDTATADEDYLPQTGTVAFPPGTTEQQIVVVVFGDVEPEPAELFIVQLTSPIGALSGNTRSACVIKSDDEFSLPQNAVQKLWDTSETNFLVVAVASDVMGNAYSAGAWKSIAAGKTNLDYGLAKYGPNGNLLWFVRYGRDEFGNDEQPLALAVDPLGDTFVTGYAGTVKYDADGNRQWMFTNVLGAACALDAEGNFLVTGGKLAGGIPEITTGKLSPDGTTIWLARYTNALRTNAQAVAIAADQNGNVLVLAGRFSGHSLLIKYDSRGGELWTESQFSNYPTSLAVDRFGDVCVASHQSQTGDILVRKIDGTTGFQKWAAPSDDYSMNLALGDGDWPCKLAIDAGNNIYVTGTEDDWESGNAHSITLKLSQDGETIWRSRFIPPQTADDPPSNSEGACYATDMILDPAGNIYVTGQAYSISPSEWGSFAHVVWMLDTNGYRRWVSYSAGAWTDPFFSFLSLPPKSRHSPYLGLGSAGTIWMAGQRDNNPSISPPTSSGMVALQPSNRIGVPDLPHPLTSRPNPEGGMDLTAIASGNPVLEYRWAGSANRLRDKTNATLLNVDGDAFSVTIANSLGSVGSPDFNVPRTAAFFEQPYPRAVALGESGTLRSSLLWGSNSQWYLNSIPISGATNRIYSFSNAQPEISGDYIRVALSGSNVISSRVARVTVATQLRSFPSETSVTNPPIFSTTARDRFGNEFVTSRSYFETVDAQGNRTNHTFTTKYGANGELLWTIPLGGNAIGVDHDGNVFVAWISGILWQHDPCDLWTAKLSGAGQVLWKTRYGGYEEGCQVMTSFRVDEIGNLLIGGYSQVRYFFTNREEYDLYGYYEPSFILKYDPHGTLAWFLSGALVYWDNEMTREPGPFLALSAAGDLLVSGRGFGNVRYHEVPVAGLPTLVSRPQDRVVDADEAVTLAVEAQGQGPLFYHWRKDGVFMEGSTNAALEFAAIQIEDAGDYSVEIRNQLGTIHTAEARLSVQSPPKIRQQPGDAVVLAGARVTFSANVVGNATLSYQWRFNDVPLQRATNNSLLITNVTPAVTGLYTLVVTNAYGAVTSAPARLEIWRPPVVADSVGRTNVPLGGSIELAIEANGTPPLRYQWRRNGVNIPGATNFTYTINQARLSDGGTYTVLVANGAGAVISDPILVVIDVPQQPAGDDFANRTLVTGVTNAIGGTNRWATREVGEPLHAGKFGTNSVWYRWVAPVSGIATFRTVGSTFDTLLGIYTGTNVAALTAVAEDEDRGGFFTSELRFNAEQGVDYAIAIDGFFGQQGSFILTWEVETTAQSLPVITTQPRSQTVRAGAGVLLQVAATGSGLTYRWHFNGTQIGGANGAAFAVNNVQPANVGLYTVAITNSAGRGIESLPAAIEIGPVPAVQGQDKLEDLFGDTPPLGGGGGIIAAALPSTFISVSAGTVDYQITSTRDATSQSWEPNHCGVIGGASKWFEFQATDDATVAIDTRGSTFDTVLAVYRKVGVLQLAQNRIDCSTDWQPGANWSRVSFQAQRNASYYVVVDGANVNDLTGRAQLNWAMGQQPTIATAPQFDLVRPGQRWRFSAGVTNAVPPPTYRWYHNNRLIPGATNDWYELASLQLTNAGIYTVAVSNALGEAQQLIAQLSVPTLTSELRTSDGTYQLTLAPVEQPGTATLLESSTNLVDWTPVQRHTNTATPVTLTLPLNTEQRFFRTRPVAE